MIDVYEGDGVRRFKPSASGGLMTPTRKQFE